MVIDTARSRLFRPACEWLGWQLIAERERWILWLPVALGLGIGVYFALPMEPRRVVGVAGFALACLLAVLIRKFWRTRLLVLGLVAFALGFVVAQTRTQVVASPVLDRALDFAIVEGEIESVEPGPKGPRVILSVASLNNLPEADKPARLRLRLRPSDMDIQPGDQVRVRGRLAPPLSASYPGGGL
jgi:competence protein ComEC